MTGELRKALLTGIDLKPGLHCRNRIAMLATSHHRGVEDACSEEPNLGYIAGRSFRPGVIFTACASLLSWDSADHGEVIPYDDVFLAGMRRWARAIKDRGARAILEVRLNGETSPARNTDTLDRSGTPTRLLTGSEISVAVDSLAQATLRAVKAGFDGIEIHGGHGYLPHRFLSAHTNNRDDRWGGSWERRCAFPLTLLQAAQSVSWDHAHAPFAVGYRFTPEEGLEDGLTIDEAVAFVDALIDAGTNYIDVDVRDYRSPTRQAQTSDSRSRLSIIVDAVAGRVPLFARGSIYTEEDVCNALDTGLDFAITEQELVINEIDI